MNEYLDYQLNRYKSSKKENINISEEIKIIINCKPEECQTKINELESKIQITVDTAETDAFVMGFTKGRDIYKY